MSAAIRRLVPAALAALALAGPASAQPRDPLPEVRERLKIEAQRVEKEVQDGRMRAYRLVRTDPEGALDVLKALVGTLRADTSLKEERRSLLLQTLQRDVNNLRALAGVRRTREPAEEAARVEARRQAEARPDGGDKAAYDAAAARIRSINGRVADARSVRERTGERFSGTIGKVHDSAVAPASDYELPANWAELSRRRSEAIKITDREKAILEGLKKPIPVDYDAQTLQGVLDDLSKKIGANISVDKQALEEANVTYDTPITLRFPRPVSARTALKRVLGDVGLTYVIRNETIEVTTPDRARSLMTTRTYYVGDLLGVASPMLPAVANQFQMMQAIGSILNQIQAIDPESWEGRGGAGTITFDPVRMAIIIRQSAEMHYMLNGLR